MTTHTSTVLSATVSLLALGVLGACGSADPDVGAVPSTAISGASGTSGASGASGTSTNSPSSTTAPTPPTVTVTTTVTAGSSTRTPQIDPSPTTPPAGKDAPAIPRSSQDYGTAFVKAWVDRDRPRATQLGTEAAVKAAFASTVETMPRFVRCEGAAGSSYCTWEGDEYTMQVRLRNDQASSGEPHAVVEVVFKH